MPVEHLKQHILEQVASAGREAFGQAAEGLDVVFPPDLQLGHFAVGCFPLSKKLRKNPAEIARTLAAAIPAGEVIASAVAAGPYINFKLADRVFFGSAIDTILAAGDRYGDVPVGRNKRVMVEYLSPNTNKPLHLGHLRNAALGISVSRLLDATGHWLVKSILINDRGVHICKSMLAWERFGRGATPESEGMKGDHFVGKWYVRYAVESEKDPTLEQNIQEMLKKWEAGEPDTLALWKKMNQWVYDGFAETYRRFGMDFDVFYYESDTYKLGKDVIAEGLKKGVFARDERGNIVYPLPQALFGTEKGGASKKVTVLRPDGTSLYITQDIGTAILKVTEHHLDSSVYVVGSEQEHHFKCLFSMLGALGYAWASNCHHLSYGMVYLPEGKMKSREGKVVDADDLIAGMAELAEVEIRRRDPEHRLSADEIQHRAAVIGVGAIKYYLLRVRPSQSINFDPAESISFDGFTGPYCQYAYARIFGILEKAGPRGRESHAVDCALLGNIEELLLLKMLIQFPEEVASGMAEYNPSRVAVHVFNTAKAFNQFYNKHAVLQAGNEELTAARLALIKATAVVLKRGLNLLGIDVLENM
ncbi:MAG: arginine--tRNA ligase [Desulfobacterales bacterium]|jgi:arginyl-tRNA synthetase|nr:arginine--tRNA ligase [Desulfobacterales bacterium]